MAQNAVVLTSSGSVLRYGNQVFTTDGSFDAARETEVALNDDTFPPDGVPLIHVKIVAGEFVEMTAPEKAIADGLYPTSVVQRKVQLGEVSVTTGGADAETGWQSAIGGAVTARAVAGGDYQLSVSFEMKLSANAAWSGSGPNRAAQARLVWNGIVLAEWLNPYAFYNVSSVVIGDSLALGLVPTIDLQMRIFGSVSGSALMQRVRMELAPTAAAVEV